VHSCPLCRLELMLEQKLVLESEHSLFLQMPQEILIGSGLIVPKKHRETVFDLTPIEWNDLYHLLGKVRSLLDETFSPDGYNLGWNCGTVGGQHIPHAHLHVIPRFADEPFAGKGIRHWLKSPENRRPAR
jgi:diadenosine tetraphosphate (Ap4A) HIT family hydrolase